MLKGGIIQFSKNEEKPILSLKTETENKQICLRRKRRLSIVKNSKKILYANHLHTIPNYPNNELDKFPI